MRCSQCNETSSELMCEACCAGCRTRSEDLTELQEWRDGKRRVFWRVKWSSSNVGRTGKTHFDCPSRDGAFDTFRAVSHVEEACPRVFRVTVKPKTKCPF